MTPAQVLDMATLSIDTLLWVTAPVMAVALVVGLIIALFQALTSIQEMTLTFVPKIFLVFLSMVLFLPFMASKINALAIELFAQIATGGAS